MRSSSVLSLDLDQTLVEALRLRPNATSVLTHGLISDKSAAVCTALNVTWQYHLLQCRLQLTVMLMAIQLSHTHKSIKIHILSQEKCMLALQWSSSPFNVPDVCCQPCFYLAII